MCYGNQYNDLDELCSAEFLLMVFLFFYFHDAYNGIKVRKSRHNIMVLRIYNLRILFRKSNKHTIFYRDGQHRNTVGKDENYSSFTEIRNSTFSILLLYSV